MHRPRLIAEGRLKTLRAALWVGLFASVTACVKNPVTGARELSLLSPADERRIGAEAAREIEASVGLVDSERLLAHVREIGAQLARYSPRKEVDYRFDIVDMTAPNAFALPDGHVYVSRGLLALSNSENELSGVLGHEIGHVAARHANQRFSRAAPVGILAGVTSAVVGIVSGDAARGVAGVGAGINSVLLAPHGRDQERQADRVGQDLAHRAGWDPMGLPEVLSSMGRMAEHEHGRHETSFFDSHPSTPERVSATRAYAESLGSGADQALPRDEYVAHLDGLLLGDNASYGVFDGRRFIHPDLRLSVRFPIGWTTARSKKLALAQAPDQGAICILGAQGRGNSAIEAAERFAELLEVRYTHGPREIAVNGKPAARAQLASEDIDITLTFVVHENLVFQLLALTAPESKQKYADTFENWTQSFETASDEDVATIHETRLLVTQVARESTLQSVLAEHPSPLPASFVAILNGMVDTRAPFEGSMLKIPVSVPYRAKAE